MKQNYFLFEMICNHHLLFTPVQVCTRVFCSRCKVGIARLVLFTHFNGLCLTSSAINTMIRVITTTLDHFTIIAPVDLLIPILF